MSANNITTSPLTDFALLFGSVLLAHTKMESARAARHAQTRSTIMMVGCTAPKRVLGGGQSQHLKTVQDEHHAQKSRTQAVIDNERNPDIS